MAGENVNSNPQHKKKAFLAAYAEAGNITRAAELAGVDRTSHYKWLNDPEYAEAFKAADEQAGDRLEQEARRRAVEGTQKPVFHQGKQCGVVNEYSDTLLIFLLKGARPEKYKDRVQQEHTGKGGGPIQHEVKFDDLSDAELDQLIAEAAQGVVASGTE